MNTPNTKASKLKRKELFKVNRGATSTTCKLTETC